MVENSVIDIRIMASIPLMFNHLKWNKHNIMAFMTQSWWRFLGIGDWISMLVTSFECWCPTLMLKDKGCWWRKRHKPSPISQSCRQHPSPSSMLPLRRFHFIWIIPLYLINSEWKQFLVVLSIFHSLVQRFPARTIYSPGQNLLMPKVWFWTSDDWVVFGLD